MIIGIHQPEYLPWLGFFGKVYQSDIFVLLDNVQYEKNYFQNRNRIRSRDRWHWLTVPVLTKGKPNQLIKDVQIDYNTNWGKKHWKTISLSYKKARYFDKYADFFEEIYTKKWKYLVDLNETIIKYIIHQLGIQVKLVKASEINVHGNSTDLLLDICKKLHSDIYLSGEYGKDYLDKRKFEKENIKVIFQEFHHPIYKQLYEPFIPGMSIIDLLFNHGPDSLDILMGRGVPVKRFLIEKRQFK